MMNALANLNCKSSSCPCDPQSISLYPNITVYTKGMGFIITPKEYLIPDYMISPDFANIIDDFCIIALTGGAERTGFFVFGDVFLRKTFVSFSKSNQTIGIAK